MNENLGKIFLQRMVHYVMIAIMSEIWGCRMKNLSLLVWFAQLGVSVAVPLGGSIWLSVWLHQQFQLGAWIIVLGVLIGLYGAFDGLRTSIQAMERLADQPDNKKQRKEQDGRKQKDRNS